MQLNEILEENSIKSISQKTKISEDNLESLVARNFEVLMKTKTLGFISILEREYKADLTALKKEALEYYDTHKVDHSVTVSLPIQDDKRGKSKLFLIVVLVLLGYASWYFFTQFDKQHLSTLIPFIDEQVNETSIVVQDEEENQDLRIEDLSIASAVSKDAEVLTEESVEESSVEETNQSNMKENNDTTESVSQF
jgi:hypothetical protein